MARVCVVGNATKDVNQTGLLASRRPGGTLVYASLALDRLGHDVHPIGWAPLTAYLALRGAGLPVNDVRLALRPTKFKNTYTGDKRTQHAREGPSRGLDETEKLEACDGILLGPVLGEIPASVSLPPDAVSLLDVQGFVRRLGEPDLWGWCEVSTQAPSDGLPEVDVLRGSIDELEAWLDTSEPREAAKALGRQSQGIGVVTMGAQGAVAHDGVDHRVRPEPIEAEDPTGSGDVFDAALLHGLLEGQDPGQALATACAGAAAFLEQPGGVESSRFPTADQVAQRAASSEATFG